MKTSWIWLLSFSLIVLALGFGVACDDDDDDATADDGPGGFEKYCNKLEACDLLGLIGATGLPECLAYAEAGNAAATGSCVVGAADCAAVEACFDAGDDDDVADDDATDDDATDDDATDDDATDDDATDDDTTVDSEPFITTPDIYLAADGLSAIVWNETSNLRHFHPEELVYMHVNVVDEGCDLAGGTMHYRLDGGADNEYGPIPGNIDCSDNEAGQPPSIGYRLDEIEGALDAEKGSHQFTMWWVDANGNVSNEKTFSYEVDYYPTSIGGQMDAFPLEPLLDKDGNEVYLSDFEDQIVVINSFAMWCSGCNYEAPFLGEEAADYEANGDPVVILGLMGENYSSSDVTGDNLATWEDMHDWTASNIMALDDGGYGNAADYSIFPAIPFNWILDADHVIRFKIVGYGTISGQSVTDWVVQQLLAEI